MPPFPAAADSKNIKPTKDLTELHSLLSALETNVGGGGTKGFNGTLTCSSMQRCMFAMVKIAGLRRTSVFVDIGSGNSRVLFHALLYPGVGSAVGIESDSHKAQMAGAAFEHLMDKMPAFQAAMKHKSAPQAKCASISEVGTLSPATHAFTCWVGMGPADKFALGRLWNTCPSLKAICIVQHKLKTSESKGGWAFPEAEMASLGFEDIQLAGITEGLKMCGSGQTFYGYIFGKPSAFGRFGRHLNLASSLSKAAWAAEMELAREAFATDSAEVAKKEAKKKKARTVALEAARVVQPADQQAAAAAASRGDAAVAQQGTRRSSRAVCKSSSMGVEDVLSKTDPEPDADLYLGEEGRRAARAEGEYIACLHAEGWEVNANGVVRNVETKKAATCRTTKQDGKGDVFARLSLRDTKGGTLGKGPKGKGSKGKGPKKVVDRCLAVKHLVAVAWRPDDLAAKILFDKDGGLLRGQGEWRIGHIDGNKYNNSAANLVLVPASKE
ncbi:hypothetical protein PLESTB_001813400 [Pleodorina starrii]|uniref:DOT1 domain-containing protein n=1 Tax=Pleodorina starrii TaxID=330485 RepID=A0A9W6FA05_9CHLO|nr:hypothetical protein PLESTM_001399400 [Pleodorina starrii]GLC61874.1 hypothetical protein PLESTB_001813400 [Pleodorina starrii]GLC75928.1 hypothetical protein PLESTF_001706900 [Pleodorina starrii]